MPHALPSPRPVTPCRRKRSSSRSPTASSRRRRPTRPPSRPRPRRPSSARWMHLYVNSCASAGKYLEKHESVSSVRQGRQNTVRFLPWAFGTENFTMEAARSMSRPSSRVRLLPTHRISSSGHARTCGAGLERPFRHTPASDTACRRCRALLCTVLHRHLGAGRGCLASRFKRAASCVALVARGLAKLAER